MLLARNNMLKMIGKLLELESFKPIIIGGVKYCAIEDNYFMMKISVVAIESLVVGIHKLIQNQV